MFASQLWPILQQVEHLKDSMENKNMFTPYLIEKYLSLVFCLDLANFGTGKGFQEHPSVRNVGKLLFK